MDRFALGIDYGTESVCVLLVDIRTGHVAAQAVEFDGHGVIDPSPPTTGWARPLDCVLQHPHDWLDSLSIACQSAMKSAGASPDQIVGIGVAFTSCTMLPCLVDGTPLCTVERWKDVPLAWPKLSKHRAARADVDRINEVARERNEPWLSRSGGTVGAESFFPKILETLQDEPSVYEAAQVWIDAGDWLVWQLISGIYPHSQRTDIVRSTCQAGFNEMWNKATGYPSREFFATVDPKMADIVAEKMPGRLESPGARAGLLSPAAAKLLGLREGIPVSAAIIDTHACVPGSGVAAPSTMILVLGATGAYLMNSRINAIPLDIAGVVEEGILPGYTGYEARPSRVGDTLTWVARSLGQSQEQLINDATALAPGSGGVMALSWLNDRRSPLTHKPVSEAFVGLTPSTTPAQMYRAAIEGCAFHVQAIRESLQAAGVPVRRFVATGELPAKSPLLMQIYADVLGEKIALAESDRPAGLGCAILGCLAAGREVTGYPAISTAIAAMARQREDLRYRPDLPAKKAYAKLYPIYRSLAEKVRE